MWVVTLVINRLLWVDWLTDWQEFTLLLTSLNDAGNIDEFVARTLFWFSYLLSVPFPWFTFLFSLPNCGVPGSQFLDWIMTPWCCTGGLTGILSTKGHLHWGNTTATSEFWCRSLMSGLPSLPIYTFPPTFSSMYHHPEVTSDPSFDGNEDI